MDRTFRLSVVLGTTVVVLCAGIANAQTPAQKSLTNCQDTVRKATEKFLAGEVKAMGSCLKKVAGSVLKSNGGVTTAIANTCVKQFRKINDSRGLGKSLPEKFAAKITAKCDPTLTDHTTDDITGKGAPGVPQPIETENIDLYCKHFGGDGSIDSFNEWMSCVQAAINCHAREAIAVEYPRAPEWLADVSTQMGSLPANPDDPTMVSDAQAGVDAAQMAIDPNGDDIPDISCGGGGAACATGCCYYTNIVAPFETSCVQWTGPTTSVLGPFSASCGGVSLPGLATQQAHAFIPGPCVASPIGGVPCAGPPNRTVVPTDSSCP
jgi:hypothetical protein